MTEIRQRFEQQVAQEITLHGLFNRDNLVLVALSGGADSVALLRVLLALGYRCEAAHANFGMRGDESDRDERFVAELCLRLGVPLHVEHFDVKSRCHATGESVEMACRTLRYAWFERLRQEVGASVVAVAHHADDNIETVLLNAVRGTGPAGLAGMKPRQGRVVRPLLSCDGKSLRAYLSELGQDYVIDSTNALNDYRRNKLRNVVLPALYGQLPQARQGLLTTIAHTTEATALQGELLNRAMADLTGGVPLPDGVIDGRRLLSYAHADVLLFYLMQPLGFTRTQTDNALATLKSGGAGQRFVGSSVVANIVGQTIVFEATTKCDADEASVEVALRSPEASRWVKVSRPTVPFDPIMCDGRHVIALLGEAWRCERLVLRHWRRGDRLAPFGMKGTRLVSDIMAEAEWLSSCRRRAWLLEADGRVLWVLGLRASRHFAVTHGATDYLLLETTFPQHA